MKNVKHIPTLRFPEFEGEWEEKKFKDIFLFSTGKNIKQKEASPEFETPCVRYGELYHMYNEVIYEIINKTSLPKSELTFSVGNEILLPSAGEAPLDIGSASALTLKNIAIGRTINILRPIKDDIYSQILVSYYINQKLRKKIATLAKGVSISNVYNSDLKTLKLNLPTLPEQQKIATFFTAVDDKIQALKKKKALLEQYKKGIMQQLFSQAIRFKDEKGKDYPAWEEKRLGEVATLISYGIGSAAIPFDGKNKYLRITDIDEGTNTFIPRPLTSPGGVIDKKYYLKKNDIVFARTGASVGKSYLYNVDDGKLVYAGFLIKFSIVDADSTFIFLNTLTYKYKKWVAVMSMRSGQPGLNAEELKSYEINLPSLPEQTQIANFLTSIDKKIEQVQAQIARTSAFKKGLLQQMFV